MLHPFAPFVTETIWQNLSWTEGMLIVQNWPKPYKVDMERVEQFEELIDIITNIRSHFQSLPGAKAYPIAFHDDELVYRNQLLIQHLTKAPCVPQIEHKDATGLRLAIHKHNNIYLQIPEDIHAKYKANLEERILKLGREINTLQARLDNPKYLEKAPTALVEESRLALHDKQRLLENMKAEFELV
jgi:valyl-tRNA synthetase